MVWLKLPIMHLDSLIACFFFYLMLLRWNGWCGLRLEKLHNKQSEAVGWWKYGPFFDAFSGTILIFIKLEMDRVLQIFPLVRDLQVNLLLNRMSSCWCWAGRTVLWVCLGWENSPVEKENLHWPLKLSRKSFVSDHVLEACLMVGIWVVFSRLVSDLASILKRVLPIWQT